MRRTSILAAALALACAATAADADTIYHFTPDDPTDPTVQLDFSSSLPVSGTAGWSLPDGVDYSTSIAVTIYGLPQIGIFPIPDVITTYAAVLSGGVASDTGATLDSGELSPGYGLLYDSYITFGPGGAGTENYWYYTGGGESPTFLATTYDGAWSLGPATFPVPEPTGLALLGLGLAATAGAAWRGRRRPL